MRIAICDDEQIFIDEISAHIQSVSGNYTQQYTIDKCDDGNSLINLAVTQKIDVVFLDISMPEISGFEIAEKLIKIHKEIIIIFVSNQEGLVFSSYEYKPFWFVPKSQMALLEYVIGKMFDKFENECNIIDTLEINMGHNKFKEIFFEETAYFKNEDHYVKIYGKDKEVSELYRSQLDIIESQLKNHWFVRVHNRFLVNCRMISIIDKTECVLINGERIPISRANMSKTKEYFQKYMRSIR